MQSLSLAERVIMVTGAGQGIGHSLALNAVSAGARVAAIDVNPVGLDDLAGRLGDRLLPLTGDISDPDFAADAIEHTVSRFGAVDGLVNNAGISRAAMISKMSHAQWRDVLDVNLSGAFYFLQAAGRQMIAQAEAGRRPSGAIVNISSDAGRRGTIGQVNYSAAKAGLLGLTMSAAREWGKFGIRVNTVTFGVVETPMTEMIRGEALRDKYLAQIPLGRWATTDEVASPVLFLLSECASYMTGQHIAINGGYHMSA